VRQHVHVLSALLLLAALSAFVGPRAEAARAEDGEGAARPFVVALPDDADTRGDWIGSYGSYVYILCGMRAPSSLYGGEGWPIDFSAATGDPEEAVRAWRSTAPAEGDRSVLREPSGLRRTPAIYDDHGEVRPLGAGPDLHFRLSIPEGPFLLSLYFFEVDWVQYRSYRIRIYAAGEDEPLVTSQIADFLKGKYSRYAAIGPADLRIVIERGDSPNAVVSAVFLDRLVAPDLQLFEDLADPDVTADTGRPLEPDAADEAARAALVRLGEAPTDAARADAYVCAEWRCVRSLQTAGAASPADYYGRLNGLWEPVEERLRSAFESLPPGARRSEAGLLRYFAARARCDYAAARTAARTLAAGVLDDSLAGREPWMSGALMLGQCAGALLDEGRRAEATPFVDAYAALSLAKEEPERARDNLLRLADKALKAGVPQPVASALERWQAAHGPLDARGRLMLGSLYYVGGKNAETYETLRTVEAELTDPTQRMWCLIVMFTALLRTDRIEEAQALLVRLEREYPGAPELDDAHYRLGVHHYDRRNLAAARRRFELLRDSTQSVVYQEMCREYIERISHLEELRQLKGR